MFKRYNYASYVKVFCVQPESAPPQRFLNRFANVKPHVVWASDCDNSGPMMSVREKSRGDSGVRMSIEKIARISRNEAEAKLQAFSDGIAANSAYVENSFSSRELGREDRQAYRRLLV
jgi:hypothetical protein